jgi:hypothetical protein
MENVLAAQMKKKPPRPWTEKGISQTENEPLSSRKQRRVKTAQSLSIKTKEKKCLGGVDSNQSTKGSSGSSNSNTNSFKFKD